MWVLLYVFFQAEDGIRDIGVTGVQTCALPISDHPGSPRLEPTDVGAQPPTRQPPGRGTRHPGSAAFVILRAPIATRPRRSEERRVGKECRSRWSPYH